MTTLSLVSRFAPLPLAVLLAAPLAQAADFPTSAELQYVGPYGVPATMTFNRSGSTYKVVASINVPMYQMRFESSGSINGNTLQPAVYTDTRKGKPYAQARFSGNSVRYGKAGDAAQTAAVNGPTFDLFTLAWQLAMNEGKLPAGLSLAAGPIQRLRAARACARWRTKSSCCSASWAASCLGVTASAGWARPPAI